MEEHAKLYRTSTDVAWDFAIVFAYWQEVIVTKYQMTEEGLKVDEFKPLQYTEHNVFEVAMVTDSQWRTIDSQTTIQLDDEEIET
jgi:hypothetical protein